MHMGELRPAYRHFEEGLARYTPAQQNLPLFRAGQDLGIACRLFTAWTLWLLGYPDQARAHARNALPLATDLNHPFTDAFALATASIIWQFCREKQDVYDHTEAAVALSHEQGFPFWSALGTVVRGWALTALGQREEGLRQLRQGFADYRASGAEVFAPYFLALLAEGGAALNQVKEALDSLHAGVEMIERMGQHWCEAELHRLKGQLLLQQSPDNSEEAESCFQKAISIAQSQSAKSWELRAATSLAKLWQYQGKRDEARELLGDVYSFFTKGFDTADLTDAKALLDELS